MATGEVDRGLIPPPLLKVSAFPLGEDTWRVDWFGELSYPSRSHRSNQPSVAVWLSKVINPRWSDDQSTLLSSDLTAHRERIFRRVAAGTLVILRIGDLWRDQQLAAKPQYEVEQFDSVDVVGDHVTIIKSGLSLGNGSYVLPAAEHPWHMGATHSYCAQVRLPGGRFLVIPALELARFYFGTSSPLLVRLLSPDFSKESICTAEHITAEPRRVAEVTLASGIPAASAHDVARLVFGTKSLARASLMPRSCIKASIAREPVFPQCVFPFIGKTDLKVKGKWLSREGTQRRTFVVYEVLSCSHPFPYRELRYQVTPGAPAMSHRSNIGPSDQAETAETGRPHPAGRLNLPKGLHEQDPGRSRTGRVVRIPLTERFPDLRFKRATEDGIASDANALSLRQGRTDSEGFALGDPSGSGPLRPVELAEDGPRRQPQPVPEFLRPVIGALRQFDGIATVLTTSPEDNWTIGIDQIPGLEIIQRHPSYRLDSRPRRFCVADLRKGGLRHLLAVCEGRPPTILVTPWIRDIGDHSRALPMAMIGLMNVWEMVWGDVAPRDSGNEPYTATKILDVLRVHFNNCETLSEPGGPSTLIQ